jgi:hypothetical protein
MATLKVNTVSGIGTEGPVLDGGLKFRSENYLTLPKGDTSQRGRGRAVIFGGYQSSPGAVTNEIVYFDIATGGNSIKFGDLGISQGYSGGAAASSTRAVYAGGATSPGRNITYVTIATTGNSIDFGADRNGSGTAVYAPGCGNQTRGIFISSQSHPNYYAITDFVTIASTGTCTEFGDVVDNRYGGAASASPTRAIYAGGVQGATSPGTNFISYATIATTGSWADFGDLTNVTNGHRYTNGSSSNTRSLVYGGSWNSGVSDGNTIQYITIATLGDSTDFGDAVKSGTHRGGFSNTIRGGAAGGYYPSADFNTIEYVNIATTGNGIEFGDMTITRAYNMGTTSDSHGGLSE